MKPNRPAFVLLLMLAASSAGAALANGPAEPDSWTPPFQVSATTVGLYTGYEHQRPIATDGQGNVHVVWYEHPTRRFIKYRKWNAGTGQWEPEVQLTTSGSYDSYRPAVACDAFDNVHVVWYSSTSQYYGIWYARWDAGSGNWSVPQRIHDPGANSLQRFPTVTCTPEAGNVHVAWQGRSGTTGPYRLWYKDYVPGTGWTGASQLSTDDDHDCQYASIGADSANNVHVTWCQQPESGAIWERVWYRQRVGGTWQPVEQVSDISDLETAAYSCIAVDPDGEMVHVVWYQDPASSPDDQVWYRQRTAAGWDSTQMVSPGPGNQNRWPTVAVRPDRSIYVTWQGYSPDTRNRYRVRQGGYWTRPVEITGGDVDFMTCAVDPGTGIHVYWRDDTTGLDQMYYIRGDVPNAPALLGPIDGDTLGDTTPTFEWEDLGTGFRYRVQVDDDSGFGSVELDGDAFTSNWTPDSGLGEGGWYWRVYSDDDCFSPWSETGFFRLDLTAPGAPTLLAPPEDTARERVPLFDWTPVSDAWAFDIEVYRQPGDSLVLADTVVQAPGEDSSRFRPGPGEELDDAVYTWRVRARDYAGNNSAWTVERWFAVDTTPPQVPVLAFPIDDTLITDPRPVLDWQPVEDARRFFVTLFDERHQEVLACTVDQDAGADRSEYAIPVGRELTSGRYTWTCRAQDYAGNSSGWCEEAGFRVQLEARDVGTVELLEPAGVVAESSWVFPRARVRNHGELAESFDVRVRITAEGGPEVFNATLGVADLAPGETREVTFAADSWLAEPCGEYEARCSTELDGDGDPTNDARGHAFQVSFGMRPGWVEMAPLPTGSGRPVKDGGWLAADPSGGFVYAAKGYRTSEFYGYDPVGDTWTALADVPPGSEGRPPRKGCRGVADGAGHLYATRGNRTLDFLRYDAAADSWSRLADVPAGQDGRKVKGGTDLAFAVLNDTGWVYLLKGYGTGFYRYNTVAGRWDTLPDLPYGRRPKWGRGSWLAYDGRRYLYAHQARYADRATGQHYLFRFDVLAGMWEDTARAGLPLLGRHSGRLRKKRAKDGSAGVFDGGTLYALKGGNSQQFFGYNPGPGAWTELDTVPSYSPNSGRTRRVKHGGDLTTWGIGVLFALKGGKTCEFWRYITAPPVEGRSGRMASDARPTPHRMLLAPNPVSNGVSMLRLSLPDAGPVSVRVFDAAGRCLSERSFAQRPSALALPLDLRGLPGGVYLVRATSGSWTGTHRLVLLAQR